MTLKIEIEAPEAFPLAEDYEEIGERATDLADPFRDAATYLEELHASGFQRLHGRYVRTGATRSSLTGPGSGAIRNASRDSLEFGTRVWYAKFLTKLPREPEMGQVEKDPPLEGRHAVLFFPSKAEEHITEILMGYVVEPFDG